MADKKFLPKQAHNLKRLYVDNGDGTFSEKMAVVATIEAGDIEIGAVELKNATTDDRAIVKAGNTGAVGDLALITADPNVLAALVTVVASLSVLDDWDEANRAAVNLIAGQIGVAAGEGAVEATVLRTVDAAANTAALSNVNDSASAVTLQAANVARLGWMTFNDSDQNLYIKFGSAASTTSFTAKVPPGGYYEAPKPIYTGIITGIWDADSTGAARNTELSVF